MSRPRPRNRLVIHWDIRGKRLELSAAGTVGVIVLFAMVVLAIAMLARML
ncbi:MAG TPA: hypothetical protein VNA25_25500 [Phycisphaerae bacterium]|nr:hypothetical protein [Phycisphaerae bacterium]